MAITKIHGYAFEIDTMDWYDADDAEHCADLIESEMMKWTPEEAELFHRLMLKSQAGDIAFDAGELAGVRQMCADCASTIFDGYRPDFLTTMVGHNHEIAAVER